MPIPDYQSIMVPLLKHLADGELRTTYETLEALAREFELTEEERSALQPSGQQPVFSNRVSWAKLYLRKAGLIESPKRGAHKITEEGRRVLVESPPNFNRSFLLRYPCFIEFVKGKRRRKARLEKDSEDDQEREDGRTPEEHLEYGHQELRGSLAAELINRIKECPPGFFERLVVELLLKIGYGGSRQEAGETMGRSGDGGIDGIIKEDRLGLDVVYVQAKRWDGVIGRPEVQKFAGALQGRRAKRGIFLTTSSFSKEAQEKNTCH